MKGTEPFIQWNRTVAAIIALKILVMEKMEVALAECELVLAAEEKFIEADMAQRRCKTGRLYMKDGVQRMR